MSSDHIVVQTTFDNRASANEMDVALRTDFQAIGTRLTDVQSIFWWDGKINNVPEQVLTATIAADCFGSVENYISEKHDYDLPCVIAFNATPIGKGVRENCPSDCVLAETMFGNLETATFAANSLVEDRMAACTKLWPAKLDTASSSSASPYCFSIETTQEKCEQISALTLPGRISQITVKPIIAGKKEFLDWIRECVAPDPKDALVQVLADSSGALMAQPLDNCP